jgi:hypothetical protein
MLSFLFFPRALSSNDGLSSFGQVVYHGLLAKISILRHIYSSNSADRGDKLREVVKRGGHSTAVNVERAAGWLLIRSRQATVNFASLSYSAWALTKKLPSPIKFVEAIMTRHPNQNQSTFFSAAPFEVVVAVEPMTGPMLLARSGPRPLPSSALLTPDAGAVKAPKTSPKKPPEEPPGEEVVSSVVENRPYLVGTNEPVVQIKGGGVELSPLENPKREQPSLSLGASTKGDTSSSTLASLRGGIVATHLKAALEAGYLNSRTILKRVGGHLQRHGSDALLQRRSTLHTRLQSFPASTNASGIVKFLQRAGKKRVEFRAQIELLAKKVNNSVAFWQISRQNYLSLLKSWALELTKKGAEFDIFIRQQRVKSMKLELKGLKPRWASYKWPTQLNSTLPARRNEKGQEKNAPLPPPPPRQYNPRVPNFVRRLLSPES